MTRLGKPLAHAAMLGALCLAVQACGSPAEPVCPDICVPWEDRTGYHTLSVQVQVEYTVGAPVVGAVVRVVVEPRALPLNRQFQIVDTTNDVGSAGGWVWFYSPVDGQVLIEVTVEPRPPFDLPVVVRRDSISIQAAGGSRGKVVTILYPPHLPPTP